MADPKDRNHLLEMGWKRGAFINIKTSADLQAQLPQEILQKIEDKPAAYLIPLLYDCALLEHRFEIEPWVQVLVGWTCDCDSKGDYAFGKNPRKLHFPVICPERGRLELDVTAVGFWQLNRKQLLKETPSPEIEWPEHGLDILLNWVSERYRQATFPDSWNTRLKAKEKLFKKLWRRDAFVTCCSGVYFDIQPFSELKDEDDYKVKVFIAVSDTVDNKRYREFNLKEGPELVERLKSIWATVSGVEVLAVDAIKESEFTKAMERNYKRWPLEYFSYKGEPLALLPPEVEFQKGDR